MDSELFQRRHEDGSTLRVVMLNWRDTSHPEGGGSERYVENVAAGLAAAGHDVTVFCAAYPGGARHEWRDGYRIVRRGGKLTVYAHALRMLATGRLGRPDVVIDVQNGVPFWSRLAVRWPVVVLVHHGHREQWGVVYRRAVARFGWWLESWLAPRVYRRSRYVTVSEVTRAELTELGVERTRIDVVHNGTAPAPSTTATRSASPRICVLGRLVPHKQVEHALTAAARLRHDWPDLRVSVIGTGWWAQQLVEAAERLGVRDITEFLGHVDEQAKHDELARCWLMVAPSVKEGWGLVVVEGAQHELPAVGYRAAGGIAESIVDGRTGVLVDDLDELTRAVGDLLTDDARRHRLGRAAARRAGEFSWASTVHGWEKVLERVCAEGSRPALRESSAAAAPLSLFFRQS